MTNITVDEVDQAVVSEVVEVSIVNVTVTRPVKIGHIF